MSSRPPSPGLVDFWKTWKGIQTRLADIAHNFTWGTFNAATQQQLLVLEADEAVPPEDKGNTLSWATMEDDKVCTLCQENAGDYDPAAPFLPTMPAHIDCRCWWDVIAP
jgi:hypothetical protein